MQLRPKVAKIKYFFANFMTLYFNNHIFLIKLKTVSFPSESTLNSSFIFKALAVCHSYSACIDLLSLKLNLEKLRNLGHLKLSPSSGCEKCYLGEIVEGIPEGRHTSD